MSHSFLSSSIIVFLTLSLYSCGLFDSPVPPITENNVDSVIESQNKLLEKDKKNDRVHYLLARAYLKNEDFVNAENHIKEAIKLSPLNGTYYELFGNIAYQTERYYMSANAYKSAIDSEPGLISSYLQLALVYEQIGDYEKAIASLEEALKREPLIVEGFYHLSRLNLQLREYKLALENIDSALNLEPQNKELLLLQIRVHSEQGSYFFAKNLIKQYLKKHPDSYAAKHERLKIYFAQEQWEDALNYNKQIAQSYVLQVEDELIKVFILLHLDRLEEAEVILKSLQKDNPLHPKVLTELALISIRKGNLKKALRLLTQSIESDSSQPVPFYLQAAIYLKQRKYLQGDLALNKAEELAPLNINIQTLSLRRRLIKGEFGEVEKMLKKMLKKAPLDTKLLTLKVDLYTLQNKFKAAKNLILQIQLIEEKENDLLDFYLARVYYFQKKYSLVLPLTQKLIQKYPTNWESSYLHSLALYNLGGMDKALPLIEPFLGKKDGEGFIHLLVGNFFQSEGNLASAQKVYQTGLEIFPQHIYLLDALSISLIAQQKWSQAYNIVLKGVEKEHPLKLVFLDRLIFIAYQRKDFKNANHYSQQYQQLTDPVLKALIVGSENQILFPIASPTLEFSNLSSVLSKE